MLQHDDGSTPPAIPSTCRARHTRATNEAARAALGPRRVRRERGTIRIQPLVCTCVVALRRARARSRWSPVRYRRRCLPTERSRRAGCGGSRRLWTPGPLQRARRDNSTRSPSVDAGLLPFDSADPGLRQQGHRVLDLSGDAEQQRHAESGGERYGRNLYVAVETLTGKKNWVVLKFDHVGRRLWSRPYDSGWGRTCPTARHRPSRQRHRRGTASTPAATTPRSSSGAPPAGCSEAHDLGARPRPGQWLAVDANDDVYAAGQRRIDGIATAILRSWTSGGRQRWTATAVNPLGMPSWRLRGRQGHLGVRRRSVDRIPSTSA